MLSPSERKKNNFGRSLLPSFGAEMRKYEEVYQLYISEGYIEEVCKLYADAFVNEAKKPAPEDVIQTARLYAKIREYKKADEYLESLSERKLSGEDRFQYCIEMLKTQSLLGRWRDAEDFRTENINFLQNYMQKRSIQQQADLYIALALVDCAARRYKEAQKLMKFGYKPQGKNDTKLLEIFITGAYIQAKEGDAEGAAQTVEIAKAYLRLFTEFEFSWSREYYERRIEEAAEGLY